MLQQNCEASSCEYGSNKYPVDLLEHCTNECTDRQSDDNLGEETILEPMTDVVGHPRHTPFTHPAMIGINAAPGMAFMSGYRDCAEEAIRFLIEVEHLSPDDPLVMGLKNHLQEQQNSLHLGQSVLDQQVIQTETVRDLNDSGISLQGGLSDITDLDTAQILNNPSVNSSVNSSVIDTEFLHRPSPSQIIWSNQIVDLSSLRQDNDRFSGLAEEILSLLEECDEDLLSDEDESIEFVEQ